MCYLFHAGRVSEALWAHFKAPTNAQTTSFLYTHTLRSEYVRRSTVSREGNGNRQPVMTPFEVLTFQSEIFKKTHQCRNTIALRLHFAKDFR